MTDSLSTLVEELAERVSLRVLARVAAEQPSILIPIAESPVGYRLTLDATNRGELPRYRVGAHTFVRRDELERWILAHPVPVTAPTTTATTAPDDPELAAIAAHHDAARPRRRRTH